jgi:hypothetical protein
MLSASHRQDARTGLILFGRLATVEPHVEPVGVAPLAASECDVAFPRLKIGYLTMNGAKGPINYVTLRIRNSVCSSVPRAFLQFHLRRTKCISNIQCRVSLYMVRPRGCDFPAVDQPCSPNGIQSSKLHPSY